MHLNLTSMSILRSLPASSYFNYNTDTATAVCNSIFAPSIGSASAVEIEPKVCHVLYFGHWSSTSRCLPANALMEVRHHHMHRLLLAHAQPRYQFLDEDAFPTSSSGFRHNLEMVFNLSWSMRTWISKFTWLTYHWLRHNLLEGELYSRATPATSRKNWQG